MQRPYIRNMFDEEYLKSEHRNTFIFKDFEE